MRKPISVTLKLKKKDIIKVYDNSERKLTLNYKVIEHILKFCMNINLIILFLIWFGVFCELYFKDFKGHLNLIYESIFYLVNIQK